MKKVTKSLLILFISLISLTGKVHYLDLEKSLNRAMEKTHQMQIIREDLKQAEYRLKAATHMFRTNIDMNITAPDYTENIQQFQDSLGTYYDHIRQSLYEANLEVSQPLPTDGRIYLKSGVYTLQDFDKTVANAKLTTRIGLEQPIESFFTYNSLKASLKEAQLQYDKQKKRLDRAKLDTEYDLKKVFYQLVKARENVEIKKEALNNQKEAYELALKKYKSGLIPESEALSMEVDLGEANNNYQSAQQNERKMANEFKQLLDIELADSIALDYKLDYKPVHVNENKAINLALKNRLEIQEQKIEKKLTKLDIKQQKSKGQITGKISAYYDFQGIEEKKLHPVYADLIHGAYDNLIDRPGNRGVSLTLSIPILDWGVNKARVNRAKSQLKQAKYRLKDTKIEVKKDILATIDQLNTNLNKLNSLEKNVQVARKSYQISKKRFENGDISSQDLALERERLNTTIIAHLDAFINYKLTIADLRRKTFYNFKQNKPIYDD